VRFTVASLVTVGLALVVPTATGVVLGDLVPHAERGLITVMCAVMVLTSLLSSAFSLLANIALLRIGGRSESALQAAVWDRLLRHPAAFFTRFSTGELVSAALGVSHIRQAVSDIAVVAVQSALLGTASMALLLWYSGTLAAATAGLALLCGAMLAVFGIRTLAWQRQAVDLDYRLTNTVFHTLRGLPKLRVAAAENLAFAYWARDFARSRKIVGRLSRIHNLTTVFTSAYPPSCALVLFLLVTGPARGTLSVGQFLTCYVASGLLIGAVTRFCDAIASTGAIVPMFDKLKPLLQQVPETTAGRTPPGELSGEITIDRVSFRYGAGGAPILSDITLHIGRGEFVAIVGPTGCGKSTLMRLLIGFEAPGTGSIRYGDQNLSSLDLTAVRRQFGVVLQNAQPLTGSILSNICGDGSHSVEDAWEAAEMAGLATDIAQMPMGMHTVVNDSTSTLSGGQRQRLMIARALVRRPRILFFDEATSALDNKAQQIVTDAIRTLDATRVVIAHRLSTIMHADTLVVLSDGRVAQQGTPAQLFAEPDGLFHRLVRRQMPDQPESSRQPGSPPATSLPATNARRRG
jgi:NHLM bacteriocin system ABC transporter ATP-binding protein